MVVGDNAGNSDATTNQKVAHNSLESGLPWLEVGTGNKCTFLGSIFNNSWVEGVLGGTVEVDDSFLEGSDAVEHGGWQWDVVCDSWLQVVDRVDLGKQEHLCIGSPKNNNFVNFCFHGLNIAAQFVD